MRIADTTNHPASTIHLKCLRDREINTDALLVDECSMIDLNTFHMMISCITNPNIKIVLIGDLKQISPVGLGTPYADIVKSNVIPVITFTKVFRYGDSGIAYANTNTRNGKDFFDDEVVKTVGNTLKIMDDWSLIQKETDEEIADEIVSQYRKLIKNHIKKDNIMVLTGYNVKECGTYTLNDIIQSEFNPPIKGEKTFERKISGYGKIIFRVGDIVINKKNNYSALPYDSWLQIEESNGVLSEDEVPTTVVCNGQKGVITDINDKVMVIKFGEELVVFDKLQVYNLLLGYVQTLHSAQGAESPYIICAITESQSRLLNRNLLYVANSRAKVKHINIGQVKAYKDALQIDGVEIRHTWLLDLLKN
jgi:exodeoxyribonuclease V alpha subunit